jgi:hypothetical protein
MAHPIQVVVTDDLRRSRVTVFFRVLLAVPHFMVIYIWSISMLFVLVLVWFAALVLGRVPAGLHNFVASWLRYRSHLQAYLLLLADPYPPFSGMDAYPVDLQIAPASQMSRLSVLFRSILVFPAAVMAAAVGSLGAAAAFLGWFAAVVTGRMPRGLRDAGAFALRVDAQTQAYFFLLTNRYPRFAPTPEPDGSPGSV